MRHCILLGRFMPLHIGHMDLIQQIEDLGYQPVLFLGESNERNERYPWNYHDRHCMIKHVYHDIPMARIPDQSSWDAWFVGFKYYYDMVYDITGIRPLIAVHNKEEDRQSFYYDGQYFKDTFYSDVFEYEDLELLELQPSDIAIRATTIRSDIEANKDFLHPAIYNWITDRNVSKLDPNNKDTNE